MDASYEKMETAAFPSRGFHHRTACIAARSKTEQSLRALEENRAGTRRAQPRCHCHRGASGGERPQGPGCSPTALSCTWGQRSSASQPFYAAAQSKAFDPQDLPPSWS